MLRPGKVQRGSSENILFSKDLPPIQEFIETPPLSGKDNIDLSSLRIRSEKPSGHEDAFHKVSQGTAVRAKAKFRRVVERKIAGNVHSRFLFSRFEKYRVFVDESGRFFIINASGDDDHYLIKRNHLKSKLRRDYLDNESIDFEEFDFERKDLTLSGKLLENVIELFLNDIVRMARMVVNDQIPGKKCETISDIGGVLKGVL